MNRIIIVIDHEQGAISPHSRELAAAAAALFPDGSEIPMALMAGHDVLTAAHKFAEDTCLDVLVIESAELDHYTSEGYLRVLGDIIPSLSPALVLVAHNARGCDYAPALASRLGLPLVTGIEEMHIGNAGWLFQRAIWHGKAREEVAIPSGAAVITVMPGAYPPGGHGIPRAGNVTVRETSLTLEMTSEMWNVPSAPDNAALTGAETVVAAGRGVGGAENMTRVRGLADLFPRSAVGGSRIACDMGLVDYGAQIGMTGKTVSPRLYIACGISGSAQHLAGMKGSQHIVAINHDPHAPIFQVADLGIVDEVELFIPAFTAEAEKRRGSG